MKPRFITHELPDFQCPSCLALNQLGDPYNIDEGSERACPKCGAVAEATDVEVVKHVTWTQAQSATPEPDSEAPRG